MDLSKVFKTDKQLEENGVWIAVDTDSAIKVARLGNTKSKELGSKLQNNLKLANKFNSVHVAEDTLITLISETVLLDWKGIKYEGEELPYSKENAKKVLTEFKDFRELVIQLSTEMETFKNISVEEDKDTLKKS